MYIYAIYRKVNRKNYEEKQEKHIIYFAFVGDYVNFENADVLFLYSTSVLNHSETIK